MGRGPGGPLVEAALRGMDAVMKRLWIVLPLLLLAAVAMWHPPGGPAIANAPIETPPVSFETPPLAVPQDGRSVSKGHARVSFARPAGATIVVYVVGAVQRPGLYQLRDGMRVNDALREAGGFARGADPIAVNLAAPASDGAEIDVPLAGETARIAMQAKPARGKRLPRSKEPVAAVDVNTAGLAMLERVPGVGATLAARIIDVREHDGPFSTFDELLDVAGMTQARLDRALPYLRLHD
jgi:competence protein ComEA